MRSQSHFPVHTAPELSSATVPGFNQATVLGFNQATVLGFNLATVLGCNLATVLGFNQATVLGFNQATVLGFSLATVLGRKLHNITQLVAVSPVPAGMHLVTEVRRGKGQSVSHPCSGLIKSSQCTGPLGSCSQPYIRHSVQ